MLTFSCPQVVSHHGEILLVSQFTLYARLKKPRPDFSKAMPPAQVRNIRILSCLCRDFCSYEESLGAHHVLYSVTFDTICALNIMQAKEFYIQFVEKVRNEYIPEKVKVRNLTIQFRCKIRTTTSVFCTTHFMNIACRMEFLEVRLKTLQIVFSSQSFNRISNITRYY
jgi:hypothetical protein